MNTLKVETLRTWLEEQQPVTILNIRPTPEYEEWSISGSIHVDVYDALKAHDPMALANVELQADDQTGIVARGLQHDPTSRRV